MFENLKPHLVELRKRLMVVVISLFIFFFIAFVNYSPILDWITAPLNQALSNVSHLLPNSFNGKVTTHQVGGAFFVALKVSFFTAFLASVPVILWQLWAFVAPGLYDNEKKLVIPFVLGGTVMFAIGSLFAYYIVIPFGFEFLIAFGSENFTPYINIEDYVGFFTKFLFGFGIAFELPIIIMFLAIMGLVTDKSLKDFFKYAVLIIFIFSAILTPPDVLTQMLMALPLIILYGASIIIAKIINPHEEDEN
jgi:sec-independent protein translocase protein TatC